MADLPTVTVTTDDPLKLEVDALVLPVFTGGIEGPGTEEALQALGIDPLPRDERFRGRLGQTLTLGAPGLACGRVVLLGMGRMDELDEEQIRRAAGAATRALADGTRTLATTVALTDVGPLAVRAAAEGAILGAYRHADQRPDDRDGHLEEVLLVVPSVLADDAARAVERAEVHARAQCLARGLLDGPEPGPEEFCDRASSLLPPEVEVEVWAADRLAAEQCGGILAAGDGPGEGPGEGTARLLVLRHRSSAAVADVALVGAGRAGSAAVVATLSALPALDGRVAVLGLCPLAGPGGDGAGPGRATDVLTLHGGTTVEVRDPAAVGQLLLADALALAADHDVDAIVDVATLTDTVRHALGGRTTAAFGNDDDVLRQILTAAEAAGEPTWHLPLWDELREHLDSDVADLADAGPADDADATLAGLFLREFVDGQPWVHLDVTGPAWATAARFHLPAEATGTGVRTLLHWLEQTRD